MATLLLLRRPTPMDTAASDAVDDLEAAA